MDKKIIQPGMVLLAKRSLWGKDRIAIRKGKFYKVNRVDEDYYYFDSVNTRLKKDLIWSFFRIGVPKD